jgi:ADP-ribose pyrophosphatase
MEHQYRACVRDYLLEIPTGTMEAGESPISCAKRELTEETGYTVAEFIDIGRTHIDPQLFRRVAPSTLTVDLFMD